MRNLCMVLAKHIINYPVNTKYLEFLFIFINIGLSTLTPDGGSCRTFCMWQKSQGANVAKPIAFLVEAAQLSKRFRVFVSTRLRSAYGNIAQRLPCTFQVL